jgi:AMP-polyphosphate phosphotransferase
MTRLDDVDLGAELKRSEQDRLLDELGARLAQLRLALGGQIGAGEPGPPLCVLFEGWEPAAREGRSSGSWRRSTRGTCA